MYDAINAQDLAALEELFDRDVVRHATGEVGLERAKRAVANAFAAFPDTRFEVEDVFAEGDRVALRVTVHRGRLADSEEPPIILEIFRVENGRVAEIWGAGTLQRGDAERVPPRAERLVCDRSGPRRRSNGGSASANRCSTRASW